MDFKYKPGGFIRRSTSGDSVNPKVQGKLYMVLGYKVVGVLLGNAWESSLLREVSRRWSFTNYSLWNLM